MMPRARDAGDSGSGAAAIVTSETAATRRTQEAVIQAAAAVAVASARNANVIAAAVRPFAYRLIPLARGETSRRTTCSAARIDMNAAAAHTITA